MQTDEEQAVAATVPDTAPRGPRLSRRLQLWRSPADQPPWARPALLAIVALATFSYSWGNTGLNLEAFYGAAVRSMSESWHNFFFASFDPWGTVSIDKLPGAFWLQALSLRIFGFHLWALVLPQTIEGALTVLMLYRTVRRIAGAGAGLVAAAALAVSPVTVLLNRGNVSDTLLILLLVLAADAFTRAIMSGRWQPLVLAGVWVGLAFQAKMLQAWIVLPAFAIAYVLAARSSSLYRRCGDVLLMGLATLVVSLSWMSVVAVVPANDRPYTDGSCNNSIYSQVFLYNGADRLTGNTLTQPGCRPVSPPLLTAQRELSKTGVGVATISGGAGRFLTGGFGLDDAWFFLPSLVACVSLLVLRRREPRTDPKRAVAVMWLAWLFFTWTFFASSHELNSYYLAALIPPMAALGGMGLAAAHRVWATSRWARVVVMATVTAGVAEGIALVPDSVGVRGWIIASSLAVGGLAVVVVASTLGRSGTARWAIPGVSLAALAFLVGPAWASGTAVAADLGPFNSPYQPAALTTLLHNESQHTLDNASELIRFADGFPPGVAVDTAESSSVVSLDVLLTGREFYSVGGFTGRVPTPSLRQFMAYVREGKVVRIVVALRPLTTNPDLRWVRSHCLQVSGRLGTYTQNGVQYGRYECAAQQPSPAGSPSVVP